MKDVTFQSNERQSIFPPFAQIVQAGFKTAVRGNVPRNGSQNFS